MRLKTLTFILIITAVLVGYQNCGNVRVGPKEVELPSTSFAIAGSFCPSTQRDVAFVLQEFYAINLTARASRFSGKFLADSDMDGISDKEEVEMFSLDPIRRRTRGILDTVCVDAGLIGCDPGIAGDPLTFGIKSIDVENQFNSGVYGEDQDKDKIPDFVELLFGTLVNVADGDISSDNPGGESNRNEIKKGLAPRSTLDQSLNQTFQVSVVPTLNLDLDCGASSEGYSFQVDRMPLSETLAFTSSDEPYLNHVRDENVILFLVVSVKANGDQEISYALRKVPLKGLVQNIDLQPDDFRMISELPE